MARLPFGHVPWIWRRGHVSVGKVRRADGPTWVRAATDFAAARTSCDSVYFAKSAGLTPVAKAPKPNGRGLNSPTNATSDFGAILSSIRSDQ